MIRHEMIIQVYINKTRLANGVEINQQHFDKSMNEHSLTATVRFDS